jgi:hypothetical protein
MGTTAFCFAQDISYQLLYVLFAHGAFQNDPNMALDLSFKGHLGGYEFHYFHYSTWKKLMHSNHR